MRKSNIPLSFEIVKTIRDIPRKDWDFLFGPNVVESYGYYRNLEESHLKEFSFYYLLAKQEEDIKAIIPLFVMDFSFDTLIPPPLHKHISRLRKFLHMKIIFIGSPTSEEFYVGISKQVDFNMLINKSLVKIYSFAKKEKIKIITFNNLSDKNKSLAKFLLKKNFIRLESLATTMIEIKARSLEEYFEGLSKNMRKDLKRKLRRSAELTTLKTEMRENVDDIIDTIYELYLNNFNDSDVHFEILTREFFKNICRNMPGVAKYFITYDKDKIVAFNLCLIQRNLFIDKFIGFDKEVALKYHLYFTTFCYNLEWCIKNDIRFYQPGTTDYYPKIRLGAKLIPLYIFARSLNPILHTIVKLTARWIEPKNLDSTLRDIEELKRKKHLKHDFL